VESELGSGATFLFTLPFASERAPLPVESSDPVSTFPA